MAPSDPGLRKQALAWKSFTAAPFLKSWRDAVQVPTPGFPTPVSPVNGFPRVVFSELRGARSSEGRETRGGSLERPPRGRGGLTSQAITSAHSETRTRHSDKSQG
ncbi:unnamed protein product [Lota lota]